jgi:hypothetical protein
MQKQVEKLAGNIGQNQDGNSRAYKLIKTLLIGCKLTVASIYAILKHMAAEATINVTTFKLSCVRVV